MSEMLPKLGAPARSSAFLPSVSPAGKRSEIGGGVFSKFLCRQQRFMARRDDTAHHYAVLDVSGTELTFTAYSLPEDTLRPQEFDRFRISAAS